MDKVEHRVTQGDIIAMRRAVASSFYGNGKYGVVFVKSDL